MAHILIVDDESSIRQLVSAALHDFDHECMDAADAATARILLERHAFDLVISDVKMPGESGLDFIAHVIQTCPDTATLILSVLDSPAVTQRAIDLGIYGYVVKPFDFASLRIAVDGALKRRELEIANRRYQQDLEKLVEERTRQLQAQHRDYEILIKTLPCVVYTGRKDWSVSFVSDQFQAVTGYPGEAFLSGEKHWNECILPEDVPAAVDAVKKAMTNDGAFIREYRIRDGQGRVRWIQDRGRIVFDANGAVDHVAGVLFDITERKEAREALRLAKEEWERTFDAVPALIDVTDKDCRIRKVNEAFAQRVGMPREHIMGRLCYEILRGLSEKCPQCPYDEGGPPSRYLEREVYNEHLGGYFRITSTPYFAKDGSWAGCISVSHDITALKKAEEEVRSAHRELEQLIAAISSILIGLDSQGRLVRWNVTAENVFGLRASEVLGKALNGVPIEWQRDRLEAAMTQCRQKKKPQRVDDLRYTRPDGQPGFLGLIVNPVDRGLSEEVGILIMGADITQRKVLEAQLAQAQKLESIGQLAAGIAHEINTPVQFIGDNTRFLQEAFRDLEELLEKYRELLDQAREVDGLEEAVRAVEETSNAVDLEYLTAEIPKAVEQTLDGVHRVAKIVLAMKEFAHPGQEEKVPTDLNKALENTLTVARNEWKYTAEVITDFDPQLPLVPCIPGEINQVFLNIIVNAAHAIKEALNGQPDAKGTITVKTHTEDDWCEIRIQDTGTGIPEKIRHRIFDPFFTTKEVGKGTGQGLAIAHAVVVEKHKGQLDFETEEGKGTTFIIRLPLESP